MYTKYPVDVAAGRVLPFKTWLKNNKKLKTKIKINLFFQRLRFCFFLLVYWRFSASPLPVRHLSMEVKQVLLHTLTFLLQQLRLFPLIFLLTFAAFHRK